MKKYCTLFFFLVVLHYGCNQTIRISTVKPMPYPVPESRQLVAGIAQADLTPPPGYPMSGYSINGRIARGYWIRPKVTALYLRDEAGTPFVFVTTDLWGITEGQKLRVLELLSKCTMTNFVGESELLLAATHSHHCLGVNVPDASFAASSIGFGFDKQAFEFTSVQIVSAITKAISSAKPALVSFATDTIHGIAKNRSVNSYLRNNPIEREQYFSGSVALHKINVTKEEIESMIDIRLTLLTVRELNGNIIGMFASYPMHPTATGDATEVYSADVFGLASSYASAELEGRPIVAFYNGAEGDVAPNYLFHNRYDAVNIARKLSNSIIRTLNSHKEIYLFGTITHRTKTIDIASHRVEYDSLDENCYCRLPQATVSTSDKAMVGASVLAGASDGRTSLSSFGIGDGVKSDCCHPEQGYKMPALKFLVSDVFGQVISKPFGAVATAVVKTNPPSQFPISIHKVGEIYFAGLPGEFTTMLGRRIKKTIAAQFNSGENNVSLVGLADAYTSYVTTPCEFNEQAYEGASNYFGISTGQVFVKEYESLAQKTEDKMQDRQGRKTTFKAGKSVKFGPLHLGDLQVWNAEEGLQNLLVSSEGKKLHSHLIPPSVISHDTVLIEADEAVAFSFEDTVNALSRDGNFYPVVFLRTDKKIELSIAEYILTIDKYSPYRATWTVRIPDISWLGNAKAQIMVRSSSKTPPHHSTFFRRK